MGDVAGTIRKVVLDGVTFDVPLDINITEIGSAYENDSIPTSGRNMRKMTKRSETREGVVLMANGAERAVIRELADRTTDFTLAYETAGGDSYKAQGWIEFENRETEENRATVKLFPRGEWESFLSNN